MSCLCISIVTCTLIGALASSAVSNHVHEPPHAQEDQAGPASELDRFVGSRQRARITSVDHHRREDCPALQLQTIRHSLGVLRSIACGKKGSPPASSHKS